MNCLYLDAAIEGSLTVVQKFHKFVTTSCNKDHQTYYIINYYGLKVE